MSQYLKPDSELGYIEDSAEINYAKFNNLRHTILGCMLGDFDELGAYTVSPEIVKELIEMPKYVAETMENMEICLSILKLDKQITFLVTFEQDKVTLSLLEKLSFEANNKLDSGTYCNVNEYILDEVITSGEINRNAIYAHWNISQYPGNAIDIFSCDDSVLEKYFGIVNRFKYLLAANTILLEKEEVLEEVEAEYANEIFAILKRYPKLEKVVMAELKNTLEEKKEFITPNKPNFAKTLNEVLDKVLEENKNVLTQEEQKEFNAEQRAVKVQTDIKRTEAVDIITEKPSETAKIEQPRVVKMEVKDSVKFTPLTDVARAFIEIRKETKERYENGKKTRLIPKADKIEGAKKELVGTLVGAGIGYVVGGVAGAVAGAVVGKAVAEADKKIEGLVTSLDKNKEEINKVKAPVVKTASSNGGINKGKGSTDKKQGPSGDGNTKDETKKTTGGETKDASKVVTDQQDQRNVAGRYTHKKDAKKRVFSGYVSDGYKGGAENGMPKTGQQESRENNNKQKVKPIIETSKDQKGMDAVLNYDANNPFIAKRTQSNVTGGKNTEFTVKSTERNQFNNEQNIGVNVTALKFKVVSQYEGLNIVNVQKDTFISAKPHNNVLGRSM